MREPRRGARARQARPGAVIGRARALTLWDCAKERCLLAGRPGRARPEVAAVLAGAEQDLAGTAAGPGSNAEILGSTADAGVEMMIVGIHNRRATGQVGQDVDALRTCAKAPSLRVVAVGGQRRVADQFGRVGIVRERPDLLLEQTVISRRKMTEAPAIPSHRPRPVHQEPHDASFPESSASPVPSSRARLPQANTSA